VRDGGSRRDGSSSDFSPRSGEIARAWPKAYGGDARGAFVRDGDRVRAVTPPSLRPLNSSLPAPRSPLTTRFAFDGGRFSRQ
jgi:hypothetical protein